ncbi:MAG: sugar ABC transporter substrate-binding protein [Lachnospiraceae bacterium]|nr:sugar ABC transporter substrate-binding protein [Lachnospiraceae bacterium]
MMVKKGITMMLAVGMIATMLTGCGNSSTETSTKDTAAQTETSTVAAEAATEEPEVAASGEGKLYGITYWCESDFFKTVADSISAKAEADGGKAVVVDAQQDSTKQIQIIEDFIAQGVDAVFLNPVDRDAVTPALQKLKDANIPVINFDSSVAQLDMVNAYVATDNKQAGVLCAEAMIKDLPDGGNIAVLNYPANSACNDREQGFLETIEGKGFNIVSTLDAEGTVEKGQTITSDILQANPDLVAIFGINDQCGMGAFAAVTTAGVDVKVYGVDGAPEAKTVIAKDDTIYRMTAAQSPIKIGEECYKVAQTVLNGEEPESFQIDVPAFTIDGSNVADYLEGWQ